MVWRATPGKGLENEPTFGQEDESTKTEANGNPSCMQEPKAAAERNREGRSDCAAAASLDHSEKEQAESAPLLSRAPRSSPARMKVRSPVAPPAAPVGPENFATRSSSAGAVAQLTLSERWSQDSLADAISAAQQVRLDDVPVPFGLPRPRPSRRPLPLPAPSQRPEAPAEAAVEALAKYTNGISGGRTTEVVPLDQGQAPRRAAATPPPGFESTAHVAQQRASALPPALTVAPPPPLLLVDSQQRVEASPQRSSPPGASACLSPPDRAWLGAAVASHIATSLSFKVAVSRCPLLVSSPVPPSSEDQNSSSYSPVSAVASLLFERRDLDCRGRCAEHSGRAAVSPTGAASRQQGRSQAASRGAGAQGQAAQGPLDGGRHPAEGRCCQRRRHGQAVRTASGPPCHRRRHAATSAHDIGQAGD